MGTTIDEFEFTMVVMSGYSCMLSCGDEIGSEAGVEVVCMDGVCCEVGVDCGGEG